MSAAQCLGLVGRQLGNLIRGQLRNLSGRKRLNLCVGQGDQLGGRQLLHRYGRDRVELSGGKRPKVIRSQIVQLERCQNGDLPCCESCNLSGAKLGEQRSHDC